MIRAILYLLWNSLSKVHHAIVLCITGEANVICSETTMTVEVKKSSIIGLHEDHLRLNDPSCTLNSNGTHVRGTISLNSCGTQLEVTSLVQVLTVNISVNAIYIYFHWYLKIIFHTITGDWWQPCLQKRDHFIWWPLRCHNQDTWSADPVLMLVPQNRQGVFGIQGAQNSLRVHRGRLRTVHLSLRVLPQWAVLPNGGSQHLPSGSAIEGDALYGNQVNFLHSKHCALCGDLQSDPHWWPQLPPILFHNWERVNHFYILKE